MINFRDAKNAMRKTKHKHVNVPRDVFISFTN